MPSSAASMRDANKCSSKFLMLATLVAVVVCLPSSSASSAPSSAPTPRPTRPPTPTPTHRPTGAPTVAAFASNKSLYFRDPRGHNKVTAYNYEMRGGSTLSFTNNASTAACNFRVLTHTLPPGQSYGAGVDAARQKCNEFARHGFELTHKLETYVKVGAFLVAEKYEECMGFVVKFKKPAMEVNQYHVVLVTAHSNTSRKDVGACISNVKLTAEGNSSAYQLRQQVCIGIPGSAPSRLKTFCTRCVPGKFKAKSATASNCEPCTGSQIPDTASSKCLDSCTDGTRVARGNTHCEDCPLGTAGTGGVCDACTAGKDADTAQNEQNFTRTKCVPCQPGTATVVKTVDGVAAAVCSRCRAGFKPKEDGTSCESCTQIGGFNVQCLAKSEAYDARVVGVGVACRRCTDLTMSCVECTEGTQTGTGATVRVQRGWSVLPWKHNTTFDASQKQAKGTATVLQCPRKDSCRGFVATEDNMRDPTRSCSDGYTGLLCSHCAKDFYHSGADGLDCIKCSVGSQTSVWMILIATLALVILAVRIAQKWKNTRSKKLVGDVEKELVEKGEGKTALQKSIETVKGRVGKYFHLFNLQWQSARIVVGLFQVAGSLSIVLNFEYPDALKALLGMFKIVMGAFSTPMKPECLGMDHSYYRSWWADVFVTPLFMFAALCVARVVYTAATQERTKTIIIKSGPTDLLGKYEVHGKKENEKNKYVRKKRKKLCCNCGDECAEATLQYDSNKKRWILVLSDKLQYFEYYTKDNHLKDVPWKKLGGGEFEMNGAKWNKGTTRMEESKDLEFEVKRTAIFKIFKENLESSFFTDVSLVVFVVYPNVCNLAFEMLNCMPLSDNLPVLAVDYTTECNTRVWYIHATLAVLLILFFAAGIPVGILWRMTAIRTYVPNFCVRGKPADDKKEREKLSLNYHTSRRVAEEMDVSHEVAHDAIQEILHNKKWDLLMSGFRPRYCWWEPIDMLRKFCIVGLATSFGRGTTSQSFFTGIICMAWAGVQIRVQPYFFFEDNILKMVSDFSIMLIVLATLAEKAQGMSEEDAELSIYTATMLYTLLVILPIAVAAALLLKVGRMRVRKMTSAVSATKEEVSEGKRSDSEVTQGRGNCMQVILQRVTLALAKSYESPHASSEAAREFQLYRIGVASDEERDKIYKYFKKVEKRVETWLEPECDLYMSYCRDKLGKDPDLAKRLSKAAQQQVKSVKFLSESTKNSHRDAISEMRVFLGTCAEAEPPGKHSKLDALGRSRVVMPLISKDIIKSIADMSHGKGTEDNVEELLTEWIMILELKRVKAVPTIILPMIVGHKKPDENDGWDKPTDGWKRFESVKKGWKIPERILDQAQRYLQETMPDKFPNDYDIRQKKVAEHTVMKDLAVKDLVKQIVQNVPAIKVEQVQMQVEKEKSGVPDKTLRDRIVEKLAGKILTAARKAMNDEKYPKRGKKTAPNLNDLPDQPRANKQPVEDEPSGPPPKLKPEFDCCYYEVSDDTPSESEVTLEELRSMMERKEVSATTQVWAEATRGEWTQLQDWPGVWSAVADY